MVKDKCTIESDETVFDEPRFTRYIPTSLGLVAPLVRDCLLNFFMFRMVSKPKSITVYMKACGC
jgi:hypothetical protein